MLKRQQYALVFASAIAACAVPLFASAEDASFNVPVFVLESDVYNKSALTDPNTGAASYSIPIAVPPGRAGLQPEIVLQYNSQATDNANIVGYGWDIPLPHIVRLNKQGTNKIFDEDDYSSSFDGELVLLSEAGGIQTFKARFDSGSYNVYEYDGTDWSMTGKDGTVYSFGTATSSRQASSTDVYKWMVTEVRDTNDNYMSYEYFNDENQIYPSKIKYTGHDSTDGPFEVAFTRESRSDVIPSYQAGFLVESNYRIDKIYVKESGVPARTYDLAYTTGENGVRTLLSGMTEAGYDALAGTTTLPAYSFAYQDATPAWSLDANWDVPNDLAFVDSRDTPARGVVTLDVDGDGLVDIWRGHLASVPGDCSRYAAFNNGLDWVEGTPLIKYGTCFLEEGTPYDMGLRAADMNGDGIADLAQANDVDPSNDGPSENKTQKNIFIGDGSSFATTTWNIPDGFGFVRSGGGSGTQNTALLDLNNDGQADVLGQQSVYYAGVGTTTGWGSSTSFSVNLFDYDLRLADFNGDGLVDALESTLTPPSPSQTDVRNTFFYTGSDFATASTSWDAPFVFWDDGDDLGARLADINGDGLVDIIRASEDTGDGQPDYQIVYLNNGSGWTSGAIEIPSEVYFSRNTNNGYKDYGWRAMDINGDTMPDLVGTYYDNSGGSGVYTEKVYLNTSKKADILSRVTLPQGGEIEYTYSYSHDYTDGSGNLLNTEAPFPVVVVGAIAKDDGFGGIATTTYSYEGADYYFASYDDRKFAGFHVVTETDDDGNVTKTYRHQGNTSSSGTGEADDHVSKIGRVYRTDVLSASNATTSSSVQYWNAYDLGSGRYFVANTRSTDISFDGNASHRDKATTRTFATSTGNMTAEYQWGEVTANATDGTFTDTGSDKRTLVVSYATDAGGDILDKPSQEVLYDNASSTVRLTNRYYDNSAFGVVTIGNETATAELISGSTYATTTRVFNTYGLVATSTNPRGYSASYLYDTYNLYPATSTNALSHATAYTYDYSSGKVTRTTDPNGFVTETLRDGLDRPLTEKQSDLDTPATLVTRNSYTYTDTQGAVKVQKRAYLDSTTYNDAYTYSDGFNRPIQSRTMAEGSNYAVTDTVYGRDDLVAWQSLPYFSTGTARTSPTATANLKATYQYDSLGRVTALHTAVGTTSTAYDNWGRTVTDVNGNSKKFVSDAFGNLTHVVEYLDAAPATTTYAFNANNLLTAITDAAGNVRNFTYDNLGRRLTAEDLHASGDGTYGSYSYSYDAVGNLTSQTDAKSQTVNLTYDALDRVLTENYTGAAGTEREYSYDTGTYGTGRLSTATSSGAVSSYTYDVAGNIATETRTIQSTVYETAFDYDRAGNITLITYPDDAEVRYTYNVAGLPEKVEAKEGGGSFANVVADLDYAPTGKVSYKQFGNAAESTYTYDADELYRLTRILTMASTTMEGYGGGGGMAFLWGEGPYYARANELYRLAIALDGIGDIVVADTLPEEDPVAPLAEEPLADEAIATSAPEATADQDEGIAIEHATTTAATSTDAVTEEMAATQVATTTEPTGPDMATASSTNPTEVPDANQQEIATTTLEAPVEEAASSTPTEVIPEQIVASVDALLLDKPADERASIKGREIAKLRAVPRTKRDRYDIEIVSTKSIEGGVEVYARAWDSRGQIGFGPDGSVDIERFRIYNPPILVPDPSGDIVRVREAEPERGIERQEFRYREDLQEALLQVIEHNLSVMKNVHDSSNIEQGKKGRTTSTFYPDPHAESTSVDGYASRNECYTFSHIRGTSGNESNDAAFSDWVVRLSSCGSSNFQLITRSIFGFYTAPIGSDTVSSATFSVRGLTSTTDFFSQSVVVDSVTKSTATSIGTSDYNIGNWDGAEQASNRVAFSSWSTSGYNNFTLNATGTANIVGTTTSWYGLRSSADFDNQAPSWDSNKDSRIMGYFADQSGTTNDPKLVVEHTNSAPAAPTALQTEGQTNPTGIADTTPEFSAIYEDTNNNDQATHYRLQVSTDSSFATTTWDTTKTALAATTTEGSRSEDISYAGSTLTPDTTYYWRIKFWDDSDVEGAWSTATSTFSLTSLEITAGALQDLNFTYDSLGNIILYLDVSDTDTARRTEYGYDDLYRLTAASTTAVATSSTYTQTYAYNLIGNFTNKSDVGTYSYSGTGKANPHAATTINGVTYTYDDNGNLTNDGARTYTWNYDNTLASLASSTYTYDHGKQRVTMYDGSATSTYPNRYYTVNGATTTRNVYAGGELVAVIEGNGAATTTRYIHPDHLGGTHVVTSASTTEVQALDYYPFGTIRINSKATGFDETRKFTGYEYDGQSDLHYAGARYYDQDIGRWISQDPVFQNIGVDKRTGQALSDPQSQNSYSYVKNNPLRLVDDNGEWFKEVLTGQQSFEDFQIEIGQATDQMTKDSQVWDYAVSNPIKGGAVTGLVGGAAFLTGAPALAAYSNSVVTVSGVGKVLVTNRLVEGSIYTYLTGNALASLPNKIQRASEVRQGDLKSYTNFAGSFALDYGPGAFGETSDAIGNIVQLAQSLVSNFTNFVQQQKSSNNQEDNKK